MNWSKAFEVIYEDNHIIIVNKQSGILTQGDQTGDLSLPDYVKQYLKQKYNKPGNVFAGVVHRLDRPVSGLVVLAKTSKGLERMNEVFKNRQVKKTYWAVVGNKPENNQGKLIHYLKKDGKLNISKAHINEIPGSLRSELHYQLIGKNNDLFLLEVDPLTGRHHQIRSQLSAMGCPIAGDVKYGFPKSNYDASICLHARRLEFDHPVKKEKVVCEAGLPDNPIWNKFAIFSN
ncbi:MAG: RluA family pseudouridine synthase [Cytophagaceae bacterium]